MPNKIVRAKENGKEFVGIKDIQEPYSIDSINEEKIDFENYKISDNEYGDIAKFLNSVIKPIESNAINSIQEIELNSQFMITDIAKKLDAYFDKKSGNFEWYQRAGKFFFRLEHNSGEKYSQIIKNAFESIVEDQMGKTSIHYNITPSSTSIIFR